MGEMCKKKVRSGAGGQRHPETKWGKKKGSDKKGECMTLAKGVRQTGLSESE